MKNKKSFISFLLSVFLCFTLLFSACSNGGGGTGAQPISLNGAPLQAYSIVYNEDDVFSKYCAEILFDEIVELTGIKLKMTQDRKSAAEREIVVGNTNRPFELDGAVLGNEQYVLTKSETKIFLYANDYMVGGAANALVNDVLRPAIEKGETSISCAEDLTPKNYAFETPKNVIFMIGDGMGFNHIEWAEGGKIFAKFSGEFLPNHGSVITKSYSVDFEGVDATDSAASATALATGYKTKNGYVGLTPKRDKIKNIRELAAEKGANTAVLTTDEITGATPGGFTAHVDDRNKTYLIRSQIEELVLSGSLTAVEGSIVDLVGETRTALKEISKDGENFFIMIEEGYIDKHSHSNKKAEMFSTLKRYHQTVAFASLFALMHPQTMLIVTADHETGGVSLNADGDYAFTRGSHSNANVPLFTLGAGSEALTKDGVCDNTDIPKLIASLVYGEAAFGDQSYAG